MKRLEKAWRCHGVPPRLLQAFAQLFQPLASFWELRYTYYCNGFHMNGDMTHQLVGFRLQLWNHGLTEPFSLRPCCIWVLADFDVEKFAVLALGVSWFWTSGNMNKIEPGSEPKLNQESGQCMSCVIRHAGVPSEHYKNRTNI